jgi:hypothetical protein
MSVTIYNVLKNKSRKKSTVMPIIINEAQLNWMNRMDMEDKRHTLNFWNNTDHHTPKTCLHTISSYNETHTLIYGIKFKRTIL